MGSLSLVAAQLQLIRSGSYLGLSKQFQDVLADEERILALCLDAAALCHPLPLVLSTAAHPAGVPSLTQDPVQARRFCGRVIRVPSHNLLHHLGIVYRDSLLESECNFRQGTPLTLGKDVAVLAGGLGLLNHRCLVVSGLELLHQSIKSLNTAYGIVSMSLQMG